VKDFLLEEINSRPERNKHSLEYFAVSCWHLNSHESEAMWKLYIKSEEGVAIQSTYRRLCESLSRCQGEIFIGKVKYIDYATDQSNEPDFWPLMHKRKSLTHEQEVRAITMDWPCLYGNGTFHASTINNGVKVSVPLGTLIEKIYVAPNAPAQFFFFS